MPGKKNRVITVLDSTSIEYVKQYRTEDGQTFERKDAAVTNATGIAFTKKLRTVLLIPVLGKMSEADINIATSLSDDDVKQIADLGNAAAVLLSFRITQPTKAKA